MRFDSMFIGAFSLMLLQSVPIIQASAQRTREACAPMRRQASGIQGMIDSSIGTPPLLRQWMQMPELAPLSERGRSARFEARVDDEGKVIASSIRIHGIADPAYEQKLRKRYREHRFGPARIDFCNVEGSVLVNFTVLDDGRINSPPLQFAGHYPGSIVTASLGPECADVRRRVRENSLLAGDSVAPVQPLGIVMPPIPMPSTIRGKQITYSLRVDSSGTAIDSTISLTDFKPTSYRKQLLSTFKATTYRPAILQGCGVEGAASLTFTSSTSPSR